MPRKRGVEKVKFGTYLPLELHERLTDLSESSGIPITRIVQDALEAYLKRRSSR
jgi:predicted DNA-binding protein